MKNTLLRFLTAIAVFFALVPQVYAGISHNGGEYINLSGSGTAANAHTGSHCNINSGSCSGPAVVKFTCDGRNVDCRSNETSFSSSQSLGNPGCGKTVQLDVFDKNCRRTDGSWDSSCQLRDYIVWYSGDCRSSTPPSSSESCRDYRPLDTQFRKVGQSTWISGEDITKQQLKPGDRIDVNCFAKSGSTLLPNAVIDVRYPNGSSQRVRNGAQLRNFEITQSGSHRFTCSTTRFSGCYDGDTLSVQQVSEPPSTPSPQPTPEPEHESQCRDLEVASGNNQTVPAEVVLRAEATDSLGDIQRYRYYFGDGERIETDQKEVKHRYESSGRFIAKVEAKDSAGKWVSSSACETTVSVKESPIESHKSACSDLFIMARSNDGKAPSTVEFKVTGYDNKGDIEEYKVDFGDGISDEQDGQSFEHRYETAGTYVARAWIKNSKGDWVGENRGCRVNVYVETEPITKQPDTGTPTAFSMIGLFSGGMSGALFLLRRKLVVG